MYSFMTLHHDSLGGTSTLVKLICACPHITCAHWSGGWKEAAGESDLLLTVGVFVLDNVQSLPIKSGLDHFFDLDVFRM